MHRRVAKPFDDLERFFVLLVLSVLLIPAPTGGTTGGRITGQVLINSEPAGGAVVFLRTPSGLPLPPTSGETTVRQEQLRFEPDFLVIPAGATIRFENHDDEIHNIHSGATRNRFDTGAHLPGTVKEVILNNPGAVPIRCRTHQSMRGLIIVAPSPYFAVADELGQFEIRHVPAGRYRVEAWHPRLTAEERARGGTDLNLGAGVRVVQLRFNARAGAGTDLTETMDRDWPLIVEQIRTELDRAISLWKNGGITAATAKVMSVQSRLYGESGLRKAITEIFGKTRAAEHERRLDALRKRIQGIGTETTTESILKDDAAALVTGLMRDAEKIPAS